MSEKLRKCVIPEVCFHRYYFGLYSKEVKVVVYFAFIQYSPLMINDAEDRHSLRKTLLHFRVFLFFPVHNLVSTQQEEIQRASIV